MLRAGILMWLLASAPLSLLMGRMMRASMPAEPRPDARSEPVLGRVSADR